MTETAYDVIVIGGGPGGYVAAIRAAQLGMKTACVEGRATLGGTCLNVGCIPSKALLAASEHFHTASHGLETFGVKVGKVTLDLKQMMAHKSKVVADNTKGIEFLFKKNKIDWLKGWGSLAGPGKVAVKPASGASQTYAAKHIILATGSDVAPLPGVEIDEKVIVSSTGAIELAKVPEHLVVIGGGVIGLEMGSVWGRLGAKVTVVEFLDRIIPGTDLEVANAFQKILAKQGFTFRLGTKVTGAKKGKNGVTLTLEPAKGGAAETLEADSVLVSIGRRPYTDGLGLETVGITLDRGRIPIDDHFRTPAAGVYAIGDVVRGAMLAHKAEEEGVACAELIAGQKPHIRYDAIPGVIYTFPEVATVGKSEEQLKEAGIAYKVGKFPFTANGRARANNTTEGFVKILADAKTDKLYGCAIIGPWAGEMIAELALALEFDASAEDIYRTSHAHPTLTEAIKEAAFGVAGRTIHM